MRCAPTPCTSASTRCSTAAEVDDASLARHHGADAVGRGRRHPGVALVGRALPARGTSKPAGPGRTVAAPGAARRRAHAAGNHDQPFCWRPRSAGFFASRASASSRSMRARRRTMAIKPEQAACEASQMDSGHHQRPAGVHARSKPARRSAAPHSSNRPIVRRRCAPMLTAL